MTAKRTHSRRSCELCKKRKSRCELPDQWVTSSTEPQPPNKACHRCRVLSVPCIVDDTGRRRGLPDKPQRKPRQRPKEENDLEMNQHASSSSQSLPAVRDHPRSLNDIIGRAQVLHDFRPRLNGVTGPDAGSSRDEHDIKTMELHGRPLRMACAMLGVAFGKKGNGTPKVLELCTEEMVTQLSPGVIQLRILHPHLPTLPFLLDDCATRPTSGLLLVMLLYLAAGSVPPSVDIVELRSKLVPLINELRTEAITQYPMAHAAAQAFEVLSLHAPLGTLPWEICDFGKLSLTRGQVEIPLNGLDITRLFAPTPDQRLELWDEDHTWLWLGLMVSQAKLALEDEEPYIPPLLETAVNLVHGYLDSANLWISSDDRETSAALIGRLGICDRISRLWLIHASLERLRRLLDNLVDDPFFDIYPAIHGEVHETLRQSADMDVRHDSLLRQTTSNTSTSLQDIWVAYRSIRKTSDLNRLSLFTLRVTMATAYIPGTPLSMGNLPDIPPYERVRFAINKLKDAKNISALFPDHPAATPLMHWGGTRKELCETLLAAVAEIPKLHDQHSRPNPILPVNEISTLALESAKVLLEMRGGEVSRGKAKNNSRFRLPLWFVLIREASAALKRIGDRSGAQDITDRTIPGGCADLMLAMERLMESWSQALKEDRVQPTFPGVPSSAADDLMSATNATSEPASFLDAPSIHGANLLGTFLLPQGATGVFDDPFSTASSADTSAQLSPSTAFIAQLFDLPVPMGNMA